MVGRRARLMHHRQTQLAGFLVGEQDLLFELCRTDGGDLRRDQILRGVDEDPGGLATGVPNDSSPGRVPRAERDTGSVEGGLVDERGVAIDAREVHRVVGCGGSQLGMMRPILDRPVVLIPTAPLNPFTGPGRGRARPNHLNDLLVTGRAAKRQDLQTCAQIREVAVGVLNTGQQRRPLGIDDARISASQRQRVGRRTDQDNAIPSHGHGLGPWLRRVDGVDAGVVDESATRAPPVDLPGTPRGPA